ncbi:MAG: hypothetical protein SchgKO_21940 [Schleiferiaceae bacterium]
MKTTLGFLMFLSFTSWSQSSVKELKSNTFFTVVGQDTLQGKYTEHVLENASFIQYQEIVCYDDSSRLLASNDTSPIPVSTEVYVLPCVKGAFKNGKPHGEWTDYGKHPSNLGELSEYHISPVKTLHFIGDTVRVTIPFAWHFELNYIGDSTVIYGKSSYDSDTLYYKCSEGEPCVLWSENGSVKTQEFPEAEKKVMESLFLFSSSIQEFTIEWVRHRETKANR